MSRRSSDHSQLFMEYGLDIPTRTIYCGSYGLEEQGVDFLLADRIIKGLHILDNQSDTPIHLVINNFGGEDDHCRAIMGYLRSCRSTVTGTVLGRAESAAAWILQACDIRRMDRLSNLMLHMGAGTKDKHTRHMDDVFTELLLARIRERIPEYTKAKLVNRLHEDWYIYPTQAVELGLADEIIGGEK